MKQTATNQFNDGMNLDLHPIVTPNSVLTDNINGTFITYNGNEFCLQNDRGNICKASLTSGFVPIGIKEHNGVIYIVSCDDDGNTEIGNYPGINWNNREGSLDPEKYSAFNQELNLNFSKSNPVQIEIQDSYDGSVNLILTDGENKPKIINSGFSVIGDKYKIIERNTEELDQSTDDSVNLIRENSTIANINLLSVQSGGQLNGGNYTFYVKFGDSDYNQTDVVAESGIVSIFNGTDGVPSTISGTLAEERTDKMVQLNITGINNIYSKLYVYFSREYSDTNGFRMSEAGMITEPFDIQGVEYGGEKTIWITGYEQQTAISIEDLNIDYHTIDFAKTAAQQQDMLFLGNVGQSESGTNDLYIALRKLTKNIKTTVLQEKNLSKVSGNYTSGPEYYNTSNIYNYLGYWPDEIYRFGVVYILNDGSTTPVFNMCGGKFTNIGQIITKEEEPSNDLYNEEGVFLTPKVDVITTGEIIKPLSFKFELVGNYPDEIKGWFIVRQKRIPRTICQGLSIGVDKKSGLPLLYDGENWIIESFLSFDREKQYEKLETVNPYMYYFSKIWKSDSISDVNYLYPFSTDVLDFDKVFGQLREWYLNGHKDHWEGDFVYIYDPATNWNYYFNRDDTEADIITKKQECGAHATEKSVREIVYTCVKNGQVFGKVHYMFTLSGISDIESLTIEDTTYAIETIPLDTLTGLDNRFLRFNTNNILKGRGLISLDPCVNNSIKTMLNGSKFDLIPQYKITPEWTPSGTTLSEKLNFIYTNYNNPDSLSTVNTKCTFINDNTAIKSVDDYIFSNVAGNAQSVKDFKNVGNGYYLITYDNKFLYVDNDGKGNRSTLTDAQLQNVADINIVRGLFLPFIGVTSNDLDNASLYSIRLNGQGDDLLDKLFIVRKQDNSPYYTIGKRNSIISKSKVVYGGDCYTNTVSIRMLRNFIGDPAFTEIMVDNGKWGQFIIHSIYTKDAEPLDVAAEQVNLADLNTVDLGYWVTFKCLSSYNLGLRSENPFDTTEYAYFNSPKSFYPLRGISRTTGTKIEESFLLNDGYNATVGEKRYNLLQEAPYYKSEYDTRIMFSNKQVQDQFTNGYRVFQGLSYHDYDKQYGSIVKLEPWGNNLFCVFEHGCAILPVNEKALMQTTTEQTIHIYGHGVLPDQMSIASADYGSKYAQTVVRTPIGIYGIDTDAKKIWRFSDKQGFETLSDMKIESFLNKCLEPIYNIDISNCDVRTHYNSFKGDVIFTWYGGEKGSNSICYNERQGVWTTKYDWVPIVSENANGEFYSLQYSEDPKPEDSNTVKIYSHAVKESKPTTWYDQQHKFEFEFVVSDPIGVNKVFDNLQIISNNVQPEGLEISVIGDSYMFKRDEVPDMDPREKYRKEYENINTETTSNIHGEKSGGDIRYDYDETLDQSIIVKSQDFNDIYKYGRRIGNIQYRDGIWYAQIEPLRWKEGDKQKEARIRDKWAKIRIRYSGKDLAVITAIKTIVNI